VSEGAVMQAIGRARGVRRTADNPVRVVVMAAMALSLTVEHVAAWEDYRPDLLTVAVAEAALFVRAMPLAAADMVKARPDLWTLEAAKHVLKEQNKPEGDGIRAKITLGDFERGRTLIYPIFYKHFAPFNSQTRYRYRTGLRGRWSQCVAPIEGGRAAMEAIVGPVQAWEALSAEVEPMTKPAAASDPAPVSVVVAGEAFTRQVSLRAGTVRLSIVPKPAAADPVPAKPELVPLHRLTWTPWQWTAEEAAEAIRARHRPWQDAWLAAAAASKKTG
jgi:hypothetical protein